MLDPHRTSPTTTSFKKQPRWSLLSFELHAVPVNAWQTKGGIMEIKKGPTWAYPSPPRKQIERLGGN